MKLNYEFLQQINKHWIRPEFILEDSKIVEFDDQKYQYYPAFFDTLDFFKDAIYTIRGPRQVGKSTLLKLCIKRLLLEKEKMKKQKIDPKNIFFFNCDLIQSFQELYDLLDFYLSYKRAQNNKKIIIFLDEISFVKDWQRTIKHLADTGRLKKVALVITGSDVLDIKYAGACPREGERLPGRKGKVKQTDFAFLPLNFHEYLTLVAPELAKAKFEEKLFKIRILDRYLQNYLVTGGFPIAINQFFAGKYIEDYVYQMYIDWIKGDMYKLGKSFEKFILITDRLNVHLMTPVSLNKIAKETGFASYKTIEEYLEIAESMFISFKTPFFQIEQKRLNLRKNKKYYFADPLLFNIFYAASYGDIHNIFELSKDVIYREAIKPRLMENIVAVHLKRAFRNLYYYQGKKEIDFIVKKGKKFHCFEVKYQKSVSINEFQWFSKFFPDNNLIVVTRNTYEKGKNIRCVPVSLFLSSIKPSFELF